MSGGTGDLTGNYPGCLYRRAGRYEFLENDRESSLYVPIAGIDPCSLPRVVIDEVHLPVEVLGDVPPFRKRYLPIPSPWHISLRSKSIQNLSLYRRRAVDGRISVRAGARFSGRIYGTLARRPRRERTGENETGRRRGTAEEEREREGDREDGRPGRRRAGGRGEGRGERIERDGERRRFRWYDEDGDKTYRTHAHTYTRGTQKKRRDQERTLAYVYARVCSFFLFLLFFSSFSLFLPGSRALLRHHEYLIIMSGVTSESPPSDSSRAEFHR